MKVKFTKLTETATIPTRAHATDAGYDLCSDENIMLYPGMHRILSTGLSLQIPVNTALLIISRSGLAANKRVMVPNSPGLIDSGYTGEIKVILENRGTSTLEITRGMRVAQAMLIPYYSMELEEVEKLSETDRGSSGLGSTGV